VLPSPRQRAAYLRNFLPAHPWRDRPERREAFKANTGLSERQIDLALGEFAAREVVQTTQASRGRGWHRWIDEVFLTVVEVFPNGRAHLTQQHWGIVVELRFVPTGEREKREPWVALEQAVIKSESGQPLAVSLEWIDLSVIYAAFRVEMERIERTAKRRAFYDVADRPQSGRPQVTGYYDAILAEVEELKARGHPAPDREVAERYGVERSTFRGHVRKARKLREQREEEKR
jgi:hypothetical protein